MTRFEREIGIARGELSGVFDRLRRLAPHGENQVIMRILALASERIATALETIVDGTANDVYETPAESLQRAEKEAAAQAGAGISDDEARAFVDTVRSTTPAFSDNSSYAKADAQKTPISASTTRVDNFESALRDRYGDRLGVDCREIAFFAVDYAFSHWLGPT